MRKIIYFLILALFFSACSIIGENSLESIELFPVKSGEKWGYVDTRGKMVIPAQFQEAELFSEDLALVGVKKDSTIWYGYINKKGEFAIECSYKDATCFSEGIAWVVKPKGCPIAIDQNGKEIFSMKDAEFVTPFSDGLAAFAQINSKGDLKWGFCDKKGNPVINPTFESVQWFSDGLAIVKDTNDKWGYIDKKGNMVVPYQFDYATHFKDGFAVFSLGDKCGVINKKGKIVLNPQFDYLHIMKSNLFVCGLGDLIGFCDRKGKILVNPQWDDIYVSDVYRMGPLFAIRQNNQWGFINKSGDIQIKPQFEKAYMFQNGIAPVVFNGKVGFINEKGCYLVNPQYDSINMNKSNILRTQYFDPKTVVALIDLVHHKGIAIDATFSDVMKKYHLDESDFNEYTHLTYLEDEEKYTTDCYLSYFIGGSPYRKIRHGYYFTWTDYEFDPSRKIDGIGGFLLLHGNAEDRVQDVLSEIDKELNTYSLEDKSTSDKVLKIYSSPEQSILVNYHENEINDDLKSKAISFYIGNEDFVKKYLNVINKQ